MEFPSKNAPAVKSGSDFQLPEGNQWRYSEFINAVQAGKVERVRFSKDGSILQVKAKPNSLVRSVSAATPVGQKASSKPVILLLAFCLGNFRSDIMYTLWRLVCLNLMTVKQVLAHV